MGAMAVSDPLLSGVLPLSGLRVVDLSDGLVGGYASRLLSDGGASVLKLEGPLGDRLRARRYGDRAPLFEHLHAGQELANLASLSGPELARILSGADVVLAGSDTGPASDAVEACLPAASGVVVNISPLGRDVADGDKYWNEFLLQALSGRLTIPTGRTADGEPVAAGGEMGYWIAGAYAALAGVAYQLMRSDSVPRCDVDVSILESMVTIFGQESITIQIDPTWSPNRRIGGYLIPGIHPASDALVAFAVVTAQHWSDFCLMIERPDWSADEELASAGGRFARRGEVVAGIDSWVSSKTSEEIIEMAALLRIPVGVVANGRTSPGLACYSDFFRTDGAGSLRPGPAVRFGAGSDGPPLPPPPPPLPTGPIARSRPLEGMRVADFTAFWAGPYAGSLLALLGAEVVHVEGPNRPDGMRTVSPALPSEPNWLERSSTFHAINGSKLGVTINLNHPEGLAVAKRLIADCDAMIENFSPRVMDDFGLDHDRVLAINPTAVYARMPAFGLDNPWRERPAFQHTIEPISGLTWLTGNPDGTPVHIMGCDGITGIHAAFGVVCGLYHRSTAGNALRVEVRLSEVAASIAAEQTTVWSASGVVLERVGNSTRYGFVQGLFEAKGDDDSSPSIAVAVDTSDQRESLTSLLEQPAATPDTDLRLLLAEWCRTRTSHSAVDELTRSAIPATVVNNAPMVLNDDRLRSRGFFRSLEHEIVGEVRYFGLPFRATVGQASLPTHHVGPPPTWGEDDGQLGRLARLSQSELDGLISQGVVGVRPPSPAGSGEAAVTASP